VVSPNSTDEPGYGSRFLRALGAVLVASVALRRAVESVGAGLDDVAVAAAPVWGPNSRLNRAAWLVHAWELLERADRVFAAAPDGRAEPAAELLRIHTDDGVTVSVDTEHLDALTHRMERHERRGALLGEVAQSPERYRSGSASSYR
jgi:hypothetical protein